MKTALKPLTILISTFFLFLSCKSLNSNLECNDFRNGTFEFSDKILNKKFTIIRKNDSQIEQVIDLTTNEIESKNGRIMKIVWINNCEYNAMLDTIKSNNYDDLDLQMISAGGLNNKIIKIEKNCATIEASIGNFKKELELCKKLK